MSAETTWDTAIEALAPPAAVEGEPQAEPIAEVEPEVPAENAETETQTTDVVAPSDAPAREVEAAPEPVKEEAKPEAEDIQPDDPEEVKALPTASARRWARTRDREAKLIDDYLDPTKPVSSIAERLEQKSASRYSELVDDFFASHGEQYLQKRYGLTAEEIDRLVKGGAAKPADPQAQPANATTPEDYDPFSDPLIPEPVLAQLRETESLKKTVEQLTEKVNDATGKVQTFETKEQERERLQLESEQRAIEGEVFQAVFPVVVEAVREYGLEENKDDPPLIAGLKEAGRELLLSNVDPVFMQDEENKKAVDRVKHWASKRERDNAMREADPLKVRSRSAAEAVRKMQKLDSILTAIEKLSESKAKQVSERGKGQPPVPKSTPAGGQTVPKAPASDWDTAIAAAGR